MSGGVGGYRAFGYRCSVRHMASLEKSVAGQEHIFFPCLAERIQVIIIIFLLRFCEERKRLRACLVGTEGGLTIPFPHTG